MSNMVDSETKEEVFGKEVGLVHKVIITGRKVGADRNFWITLADNEEMFRRVVLLVGVGYEVVINRNLSRREMIEVGKYDEVNSDITEQHFPVKGKGKQTVNIVLFNFNHWVTNKEVLSEMKKANYRPANSDEHLALGAQYPELQKQFPIACVDPGSVWQKPDGYRCVLCLGLVDGDRRGLGLHSRKSEHEWSESWRFAGVREE